MEVYVLQESTMHEAMETANNNLNEKVCCAPPFALFLSR